MLGPICRNVGTHPPKYWYLSAECWYLSAEMLVPICLNVGTYLPKCSYLSTERLIVYVEVLVPLCRKVGTPVLKLWCLSTKHLNNHVSQYRKTKTNKLALKKNMEAFRTRSASLVNLKHRMINFKVYIQTVFSLHTPTNCPAKIVSSYSLLL
jgi:hypothetical protein